MPSDWRPIETAPKDGRRVLLWGESLSSAANGLAVLPVMAEWMSWHDNLRDMDRQGWRETGSLDILAGATDWQPLPELPTSQGDRAVGELADELKAAAAQATQEDREAAADYLYGRNYTRYHANRREMLRGTHDHHHLVHAFVRHRLAIRPQPEPEAHYALREAVSRLLEERDLGEDGDMAWAWTNLEIAASPRDHSLCGPQNVGICRHGVLACPAIVSPDLPDLPSAIARLQAFVDSQHEPLPTDPRQVPPGDPGVLHYADVAAVLGALRTPVAGEGATLTEQCNLALRHVRRLLAGDTGIEVERALIGAIAALTRPPARDELVEAARDAVTAAYVQGAQDVHDWWQQGGEPGDRDDFGEAASDYAAALAHRSADHAN